ncbi:hypothetical protein EDD86DRAFT_215304 [Gorgonomyces haynaldii]|nr:hypothetical protein EDD86DRAFT_215304 [Gorgonomyces haynaldii]
MTLFLNDSNVSHTTTNDRILLFQDDQQARFYPFWASRMIDIKQDQELDKQSLQDPEQCSKILGDLSIGILSIGKQLTNVSKQEAKKIFDEFSDKFRKELPPSGTISSLAQFRGIMSIDEFIQQQGYSKTRLESEVVWPAPTIISV